MSTAEHSSSPQLLKDNWHHLGLWHDWIGTYAGWSGRVKGDVVITGNMVDFWEYI